MIINIQMRKKHLSLVSILDTAMFEGLTASMVKRKQRNLDRADVLSLTSNFNFKYSQSQIKQDMYTT